MFLRLWIVIKHAWIVWQVLSLPKNRSKGTWRRLPPTRLLDLAAEELHELADAMKDARRGHPTWKVQLEAADVSAYMAMISDLYR